MSNASKRVLILGAGPVGLGASLELARCGVPSLVIEKHDGLSWHPKTRNFNTRTMEIARGWGRAAYGRLRNIDTPPGWKSPIRFLESATGQEYGLIESKGFEGPGGELSPAEPIMSSQELIEEIMLDAALASGLVEVEFGTEATRLIRGSEQDAIDVELELLDRKSGARQTVTGPALVAADGAASLIRGEVGLELEGAKDLSHIVNCYFRADIEPHLEGRNGVLLFVHNPDATGVLQPLDAKGRWLCQINVQPEDWKKDVFAAERAQSWVRAAVGIEDLDVEILSIGFWKLNATVIDKLVSGRVVFCGDAAHQFPPTGGLGVNTGLQGMHNAMWKLAYCVKGAADWALLETYNVERRPVAQRITQQSLQNSINVKMINDAAVAGNESHLSKEEIVKESRRYGNHLGVEFGEHYTSDAVVADGTQPPETADSYSDYVPSATPGCRAPHFWFGDSQQDFSPLDLVSSSFTLIAAKNGGAWIDQVEALTDAPIATAQLGKAGLNDHGKFESLYAVDPEGAVLIRPDGHIAWRCKSAPTTGSEITDALRQIIGDWD